MRKCLATALTDIRTLIAQSPPRLVQRIRSRMLEARVALDDMIALDCQYDAEGNERSDEDAAIAWAEAEAEGATEQEFIQLCNACWSLSTCKSEELMTAFAMDSTTGYTIFADDAYTLEYEPKYIDETEPERRYARAFPIYPWVELCEGWGIRAGA